MRQKFGVIFLLPLIVSEKQTSACFVKVVSASSPNYCKKKGKRLQKKGKKEE